MLFLRPVFCCLLLASFCLASIPPAIAAESRTVPVSPAEMQATIEVPAGYRVQLVAAEPEVIDPVAIRFDETGRMWVAEMRDYPLGPIPGQPGMSTIRLLEDHDADGRYESATLFADQLLFVTGLQPWQGGVIVTVSGQVLYLKDTNGDNKADTREVWFEGFSETNSQLRANHPTLTPDGYVYIAGGLRGGMVVDKRANAVSREPINISGMDFRFDPLRGTAEAVSGAGQFGLTFDDFGNRFVCSNRNPAQQVVFENEDLKRVPSFAVPAVMHDVAKAGEQSRIYASSKAWTTSNLHAGQFTAACGVTIYRGHLLEKLRGNLLTCDPTGNLIHLENVDRSGAVFTSTPAFAETEFLRSNDDWFRPVSMQVGPDGALYVVDMCRAVIEHPEWVPDELKKRPDERYGDAHGRIWKIVPTTPVEQIKEQGTLIGTLGSQNAWRRDAAIRALLENGITPEQATQLATCIADANQPLLARHLSARLLQSKQLLGADSLTVLLQDAKQPDLRRLGLQIFGQTSSDKRTAESLALAAKLLRDPQPQVAFTAMVSLAGTSLESLPADTALPNHLQQMASWAGDDSWKKTALLMFAQRDALTWLKGLATKSSDKAIAISTELLRPLAQQVGGTITPAELATLLPALLDPAADSATTRAAIVGLGQGLAKQSKQFADIARDDATFQKPLAAKTELATREAADAEKDVAARLLAIDLLSVLPDSLIPLTKLAVEEGALPVRQRAISALARQASLEPWKELLGTFSSQSPPLRQSIVDGVLSSKPRIEMLLDLMQAGQIKPTELDVTQQNRLLSTGDAAITQRATTIVGSSIGEDRKKALADYQTVLTMTGDARQGQAIFVKNCSVCHKIGDVGVNVAPDISDSRTKTAAQILGDILQPNRAIDANYVAYTLLTTDGITASGILSAETSTSVTLKMQSGKLLTVPRSEIELLRSTGVSLMPEGLERNIPPEEMAHLLSFIKNWRYLSGEIPGLGK